MRKFGLYLNNSEEELIDKVVASDIYQAQHFFCERKHLDLYNLTIIYYIKEIE